MAKAQTQQELMQLYGRIWESDLLDYRGWRVNFYQDWKARLRKVDNLYQGNWDEIFPDESIMRESPHIMNLVQAPLDDIARLVSEATASVKCPPTKETDEAKAASRLRERIADTYWDVNDGSIIEPRLAMDIAGAGCAFLVVSTDANSEYPCIYRVDPRYAYPDVRNGKLVDLLTVESVNLRIAARLFPQLGLDQDPTLLNRTVEIISYYEAGLCLQGIAYSNQAGAVPDKIDFVSAWQPKDAKGTPILPVAFAQMDSFDGAFRGMFDQVAGSLQTKNRIVKQLLDYTDEVVYAPRYSKGVQNPEEPWGPDAEYRLDPNVPDAAIGRVPPAASAPQIFNILEFLDREQRGGVGYPAARQGEITQSIASATFVASTQGQLTSNIRNIQRLECKMRKDVNEICFKLDESYLDREKQLSVPLGKKQTYKPRRDIAGVYMNTVSYGAASGLDRIAADNRILQLLGAGILSKDLSREQIDFISDPAAIADQVTLEAAQAALLQKMLADGDPQVLMTLVTKLSQGRSFTEAVAEISAEQQQAAAAAQQQGMQPQGAPAAGPQAAAGGEPVPQAVTPLPPFEQIRVMQPQNTQRAV